jgi:hypothetical protein
MRPNRVPGLKRSADPLAPPIFRSGEIHQSVGSQGENILRELLQSRTDSVKNIEI